MAKELKKQKMRRRMYRIISKLFTKKKIRQKMKLTNPM